MEFARRTPESDASLGPDALGAVPDDPTLAHLVVVAGGDAGWRCPIDRRELVIGRSGSADLHVSDVSLSQQHAKVVTELTAAGVAHRIVDLGSTNGTFVGERRVSDHPLRAGDRIRLGRLELVYDRGLRAVSPDEGALVPVHAGALEPAPLRYPPVALQEPDADDPWAKVIAAVQFVRRYGLAMVVGTVIGAGAGVGSWALHKPPATAQFQMSLDARATDNPVESQQRKNFEYFRQPREHFMRPAVIAAALSDVGDDDVTVADVAAVEKNLELEKKGQSVFAGTYSAATPEDAEAYLEAHLEHYLQREIDGPLQGLIGEIETLRTQLHEVETELSDLELAKADWAREAGGVLPQQAPLIADRVLTLQSERSTSQVALKKAKAEYKLAKKLLASEDPQLSVHVDEARPYADRIAVLKAELAQAEAAGKGSMHPDVINRETEIATLEAQRDKVLAHGATKIQKHKNPAYAALRTRVAEAQTLVANAKVDVARVAADLEKAEAAMAELPARDAEYAELSRALGVAETRYGELAGKLEASEVRLLLERRHAEARFDLLVPPYAEPVSRTKTLVLRGAIGATAGLMLMFMLGLLIEASRAIAARVGPSRS